MMIPISSLTSQIAHKQHLCYNNAGDNMKKIWILISICLLCACHQEVRLEKHSDQILDAGFDTFIQLVAYTETKEEYENYLSLCKETFQYYNTLFDRYHTYEGMNNLKTINDNAGKQPVKVDRELIDLLIKTKEYATISEGRYDVSYGAVLEVWHTYRERAVNDDIVAIPTQEEMQDAKKHTGWDTIEIDEATQTVYINDPLASIDLGSAAKGYAAEQCAKKLQEAGLSHGILNAGGNVRIIGDKPEDKNGAWSVGIQLPSNLEMTSLATVFMDKDSSFVTSGDYQRAYEYEGVMYHHIIDFTTLMPARYMRAVTVVCEDSGIADILSTSLFAMSYEEGCALLEKLDKDGIHAEAVWVFDASNDLPETKLYQKGDYMLAVSDGLIDQIDLN